MGLLQSKSKTVQNTHHVETEQMNEILLCGYIREFNQESAPNDIIQILLLYLEKLIPIYIAVDQGKIVMIENDTEKKEFDENAVIPSFYAKNENYKRKLGVYHYNLIPSYLNKILLQQIKPLQSLHTNFRGQYRYHNNLQIQDLIDPYKNVVECDDSDETHWIPTIFEKRKDLNSFKIISEINDLSSKTHLSLYQTIETIFNEFVPLFNNLLYDNNSNAIKQRYNRNNKDRKIILDIYDEDKLFVIIKMQDYIFNGNYEYEPKWHKEGYDGEHINAVGIYYFDIINNEYLEINNLDLRCITGLKSKPNDCGKYWRLFDNKSIETKQNLCIVFKNNYAASFIFNEYAILHKPHLKVNIDSDKTNKTNINVSRKILSFFLIDPTKANQIWNNNVENMKMIKNVNKVKLSNDEIDRYRESKNTAVPIYGMKPPSWMDDDPLIRIVYAGMGD